MRIEIDIEMRTWYSS